MPATPSTESDAERSRFDKLGEATGDVASRSTFFVGCVLLVVIWGFSYVAIQSFDTWQLIINTITTIITFLLLALLQNSQRRSERALHAKLNAIADVWLISWTTRPAGSPGTSRPTPKTSAKRPDSRNVSETCKEAPPLTTPHEATVPEELSTLLAGFPGYRWRS